VSVFDTLPLARLAVAPRKTIPPGARLPVVALVVTTVAFELTILIVGADFAFAEASSLTRNELDPARVAVAFRTPRVSPLRLTLAGTTMTRDPLDIRRIDDVSFAFV
jgi:hypothetical protein